MSSFENIKGIVSDLDGVFMFGEKVHPQAADFVKAVRERGWKITFASNGNGGRESVAKKLTDVGIGKVISKDVMTAGYATAYFLKDSYVNFRTRKILLLGPQELREQCLKQNINSNQMLSAADVWDPVNKRWIGDGAPTHVVVGRHDYTLATVEAAAAALRRGAQWIATGKDAAITTESGDLRAGTGTLVAAIQRMASAGHEHRPIEPVVIGKPNPNIVSYCHTWPVEQMKKRKIWLI